MYDGKVWALTTSTTHHAFSLELAALMVNWYSYSSYLPVGIVSLPLLHI
jgi:hypothetical protein